MDEINIECQFKENINYNYDNWNISDSTYEQSNLNYYHFFKSYLCKNIPCLIKNVACNWECTEKWIKDSSINYDYIIDKYGELEAPVADCGNIEYNSHCKSNMKVSEYMELLKKHDKDKLLYLKDWHLKKSRPDDIFYEVPIYFASDWLNEYALDNKEDDFMFVYVGPTGSWTPLHEDVYRSYSWSVNVVGQKRWLFLPPGEEDKIKDPYGMLPLLFDREKHKDIKYYEIIQETGDALFVPSGWHHQVINEMDTISINHNWINACNIEFVWKALLKTLESVEHEIAEFKESSDFSSQCQLILKSIFGMDLATFITMLSYIAKKRLSQLRGKCSKKIGKYYLGLNIITLDLTCILKNMESISVHPIFHKERYPMIEDFLNLKRTIEETIGNGM